MELPFFPLHLVDITQKKKDIWNHMYIAAVKLKFSKKDQENLELKFRGWQKQLPNDNSFFRGYGSIHERRLEPDKIGTNDTDSDEVLESSILVTYFDILSFRSKEYHIFSTNQAFKCFRIQYLVQYCACFKNLKKLLKQCF